MVAIKYIQSRLITKCFLKKTFTTQSMSNAWTVKKVVPDVVNEVPPNKLGIQYPEITINEGTIVKPRQVKDSPVVSWKARDKSSLFALCLIDPDAPSRTKPKMREWLHWLVVNIKENNIDNGETLAEYIGAGPPKETDLHRYVFLLYAYPKKISSTENKISNTTAEGRSKFSIKNFAQKYNFGDPIAGNFFMAEYDDYVPELFKKIGL